MTTYYKFELFIHEQWMKDEDYRTFKSKKTCEKFARSIAANIGTQKFRIIEYTTKVVKTKKTAPRGYKIG